MSRASEAPIPDTLEGLRAQNRAMRSLLATQEEVMAGLTVKGREYQEAITTLDSEREANAILTARVEQAEKDRSVAIRWANQSVEMLQAAFFPVADALRDLERYLRDTSHHNAIEAAAARKALREFDVGSSTADEVKARALAPDDGEVG